MIKNPKINSTLITVEDSREIICQIDPSLNNIDTFIIPDKLKLLLKGKADGFGRDIFFKKLKNIERTILILRIKDSPEIIGGYNPLKWKKLGSFNSTDCCYSETCASFIFSLKRGNLENSIFSKIAFSKHAIYREKGLGPCFSLDLFMASDKKGKTWGCFKSDYECKIRDLDGWFQIEDYEKLIMSSSNVSEKSEKYHDWLKKELEKGNIAFFEYSLFSNIKNIGEGGFGLVSSAEYDGVKVALKSLKTKEATREFVNETTAHSYISS
ncbi:18497_t:CDS:2 [Dentiscutata erythropus]|uniref:18497_t:CDS:1 n=1 Tax=Dentiscutata erythropus TaxID=1348616 RepID=A0A9N9AR74_9GLOM|nr:18497_t:CDS:2 [Dentiscutata erythropus]